MASPGATGTGMAQCLASVFRKTHGVTTRFAQKIPKVKPMVPALHLATLPSHLQDGMKSKRHGERQPEC